LHLYTFVKYTNRTNRRSVSTNIFYWNRLSKKVWHCIKSLLFYFFVTSRKCSESSWIIPSIG